MRCTDLASRFVCQYRHEMHRSSVSVRVSVPPSVRTSPGCDQLAREGHNSGGALPASCHDVRHATCALINPVSAPYFSGTYPPGNGPRLNKQELIGAAYWKI
ncbi:hypothetical protein RRG08_052122 [Elysia crispata]|uniref:Uncharacterized protein n=1 Tax=Elysia crispata TaxID=231223 RepID=A0AAE1DST0_9GAST|nr:hypothetical protein RRG08_052122 [Elysia crispata]